MKLKDKIAVQRILFSSFLAASATVVSPSILAADHNTLTSGFYVGAGLSYNILGIGEGIHMNAGSALHLDHTGDHYSSGAGGELFAGYGKYLNSVYLAAEIFGNFNDVKEVSVLDHSQGGIRLAGKSVRQIKNSFGINFKPGYKLNDSALLYGLVGYSRASFKEVGSDWSFAGVAMPPLDFKKNVDGVGYGLGLESAINNNVSFRVEFKHVDYEKVTPQTGEEIKPSTNQFLAGLAYKFN